jgi:alpha-1,2-mannosyltransferase
VTGELESQQPFILVRVLDRATRPPFLTLFAILQALAVGFVVAGHLATRTDPVPGAGDPETGDFAAFFTGALMVREGRGPDLYDMEAQKSVQDGFLGEGRTQWQPYINPPALAVALAPVTALGYATSFRVFAGVQALFLLGALCYLMGATPGLSRSRLWAVTAILLTMGCLPVALTTFGGQNTGFTLALLAGIFAAVRRRHTTLAGVLLGILTFKPQYTIFLGVVLLVRREMRVVIVAAAVSLLHYAVSATVCGVRWPVDFLTALAIHGPIEMMDNAASHFSLPAAAHRLLPDGAAWLVTAAGGVLVLALVLRGSRRVPTGSARFPAFFGMLVAGTLLLSPHLQYYESGILTLPVLLGVASLLEEGWALPLRARGLLAVGYLSFPAWELSETLGIQPLLVLLLAIFLWTTRQTISLPHPGRGTIFVASG